MEVVFHPAAREELDASIDFYEACLKGLGGRFLTAVEEAVRRIVRSPAAGSSVGGDFRKRLVPGFPFSIVYRTSMEERIFIIAVAHHIGGPATGAGAEVGANNTPPAERQAFGFE